MALAASTLLFALGHTLLTLVIARLLQGLSSAIVTTIGSTLIFDRVGKDGIGQAMGLTSMSLNLGILLGPVVGGLLYEYEGYFHVFIPAFGLVAVDIVLRLLVIVEQRTFSRPILQDSAGAGTCSDGNHGSETTFNRSSSHTESEPLLRKKAVSTDANSLLVLLSSPRFVVAIAGLFILNSFTGGFDSVLPVYVRDKFRLGSSHVSVLFLAMTVPLLLSPISGRITDRHGAKWPAVSGLMLIVPSLILLRIVDNDNGSPFMQLAALMAAIGLALAIAIPPLITEVSSAVEQIELANPGIFGPSGAYGQAYGLLGSAFAGGALVGPLYAGFVRDWLGWKVMSLSMGILGAITLLSVLTVTGTYTSCRGGGETPITPEGGRDGGV